MQVSAGVTGHVYLLDLEGLLTQGWQPGRSFGEAVGGILAMDSSDWSNVIRHYTLDTRSDTEFKPMEHTLKAPESWRLRRKCVNCCQVLLLVSTCAATPGSSNMFWGGFGHGQHRRSSSGGGVGVVHYEQTPTSNRHSSSGGGVGAVHYEQTPSSSGGGKPPRPSPPLRSTSAPQSTFAPKIPPYSKSESSSPSKPTAGANGQGLADITYHAMQRISNTPS